MKYKFEVIDRDEVRLVPDEEGNTTIFGGTLSDEGFVLQIELEGGRILLVPIPEQVDPETAISVQPADSYVIETGEEEESGYGYRVGDKTFGKLDDAIEELIRTAKCREYAHEKEDNEIREEAREWGRTALVGDVGRFELNESYFYGRIRRVS